MTAPIMLAPDAAHIPSGLKELARWAPWRAAWNAKRGKFDKIPHHTDRPDYGISTARPAQWSPFDAAWRAMERGGAKFAGVGYCMTGPHGVIGVDLDNCVEGGVLAPWAAEIVAQLASYTEISPSGRGCRIMGLGELPRDWNNHDVGIEVYGGHEARFLTITGAHVPGTPTELAQLQPAVLEALTTRYAKERVEAEVIDLAIPELLDEFVLPDLAGLQLPDKVERFLAEGEHEGDRSGVLHASGVALYLAGLGDEVVFSLLAHNRHAMAVALDHRRQDNDRALRYLWREHCVKARGKAAAAVASPDEFAVVAAEGGSGGPPVEVEPSPGAPSEDAVAERFVRGSLEKYRYVARQGRWLRWDGMRWREDSTARVYDAIRRLVRVMVRGTKAERTTASASFVSGVERLARTDPAIVVLPEDLDADPWVLNTPSGLVDLRTGRVGPHDPGRLCTRLTAARVDEAEGAALWREFLGGITLRARELEAYLQRVAGYCATGATTEDVLVYLYGVGANGKSSFAEAVAHALGDYAMIFSPEVLMEAKGERHPTELAQFQGVRFALTSEPNSRAAWNDQRVKQLTGDAVIAARFMRGDFFQFPRSHKTVVLGNHKPALSDVTHAIRRRFQMVPFAARFQPSPGPGMRERLRAEAGGAILAWVVAGAKKWMEQGTAPPACVRAETEEYLEDQDQVGQWIDEECEKGATHGALLADLYASFSGWCASRGYRPRGVRAISDRLVAEGFEKQRTMHGAKFFGLRARDCGLV